MRIQRKMFLVIFMVFTITIFCVTSVVYFASNKIIIDNYREKSDENLEYMLQVANDQLSQINSAVNAIVTNPTMHDRIEADFYERSELEQVVIDRNANNAINMLSSFQTFKGVELIYIQGVGGVEYWYGASERLYDRAMVRSEMYNAKCYRNKMCYQGMTKTNDEGEYYMKFASNIYSIYGEKIGKMYLEISNKFIENLFPVEEMNTDTTYYLLDERGIILATNKGKIGVYGNVYGDNETVSRESLEYYGWRICAITPEELIIEDSDQILYLSLLIGILSVLIEGVCLTLVIRKILRPVKVLGEGIEQVKTGALDVQIECVSDDEIGDLANTFNEMTTALRESLEREVQQNQTLNNLEYEALQAQINPHFICNTLNSLRWMAEIQKADNIIELVDLLWVLFRKTACVSDQKVELKDELEIVEIFVKIQQIKYNYKFQYHCQVAEEYKNSIVPKYIIQPIVENAIFHGVEGKVGRRHIHVQVEKQAGDLHICIQDDGVGMTTEQIQNMMNVQIEKKRGLNGIGVGNVDMRLKLLYGESYGLSVQSVVGEGTSVVVRIPIDDNVEEQDVSIDDCR